MLNIKRGSSKTFPLHALNDYSGVIDLTSLSLTATIKSDRDSAVNLVQKVSSDSTQIEILTGTSGLYLLKLLYTDTYGLNDRNYFISIVTSDHKVILNDILRIEKTTEDAMSVPFALERTQFAYWDCIDGTITLRSSFGFTTDPTVVLSGNTLTFTSADSEFEDTGYIVSPQREKVTETQNTSTIVIDLDDVSDTFIFYWENRQ